MDHVAKLEVADSWAGSRNYSYCSQLTNSITRKERGMSFFMTMRPVLQLDGGIPADLFHQFPGTLSRSHTGWKEHCCILGYQPLVATWGIFYLSLSCPQSERLGLDER